MSRELVTISAGDSVCTIAPSNGGSLASWHVGGQPMLRTAIPGAGVTGSASFPLVPYSNRIGFARFDWNGRNIKLPPYSGTLPHAHHGVGWNARWDTAGTGADHAMLTLDHRGDTYWPWPFKAQQHIIIAPDGLKLSLSATNLADEPAPLAFGHHPYFDADGARLNFRAKAFYPVDADSLPVNPVSAPADLDFSTDRDIDSTAIDNLYGDWTGAARVAWQGRCRALEITSSLPHAVLYTPPGKAYFCFEPVPHITNALNRADGDMPVIAPGESFEAWIEMRAVT